MSVETEQVRARDNQAILANAIQLGVQIISGTIGNDVSSSLRGESITEGYLADAIASRLKSRIAPFIGGV